MAVHQLMSGSVVAIESMFAATVSLRGSDLELTGGTGMGTGQPVEVRSVPILMYHSISGEHSSTQDLYTVHRDIFREQIGHFADAGYTSITISQYAALVAAGQVPRDPCVVITFDDAYVDFLREALPILRDFGMVATVYVPTGFVGGKATWSGLRRRDRCPILSWDELRELPSHGIEVGSHGHSHVHLDLLRDNSLVYELTKSKSLVEDRIGVSVSSISYPYGHFNSLVMMKTKEVGFFSACAVNRRLSSLREDRYALSRLHVRQEHVDQALVALLERDRESLTSIARSRVSWISNWCRRAVSIYNKQKIIED